MEKAIKRYWPVFVLPTLIAFIIGFVWPFIWGAGLSFCKFTTVKNVQFVGLSNYKMIWIDDTFTHAFWFTAAFTVVSTVLINVLAFSIALLLTRGMRGTNAFRTIFFLPNLIGGIVLGYIWQFVFNNVITQLGSTPGLGFLSKSLISNKDTVIWAMSLVNVWQYAGYIMMIYVAAIQGIPANLMEAASVDGANYWTRLTKILIPMMASSFTITTFLTLTNSFKQFDLNMSLTNGGPAGMYMMKAVKTSELLALNIYNTAITKNMWGDGQARAVIFFIVLVCISLVQVAINKRKEVEM